jgi:hypothetical protein
MSLLMGRPPATLTNHPRPPIVGCIPGAILSAGEVAAVYENREPLANVVSVLLFLLPIAVWCAVWLWCVDWAKLWPVLGRGGWAPAVLLIVMGGFVWGRIDPVDLTWPGYYLPAMAWHVGAAVSLACLAMICGWLQGVISWTPPEFPVHPPAAAHADGHGHDHGHH